MQRTFRAPRGSANAIAIVVLVLMALAIGGLIFFLRNQKTTQARVYFDNGLEHQITVELQGMPPFTVEARSAVEQTLSVGHHSLVIKGAADEVLESTEFEITAAPGITDRKWVFNVKNANRYQKLEVAFGKAETKPPESLETAQLFELPSAATIFLPAQGVASKGTAGTVASLVAHQELHPDAECCLHLLELAGPNSEATPAAE